MITLKLKSTSNNGGSCTLAPSDARIGVSRDGNVIIYVVQDIPYGVPAHQVIQLFNASCQICGHVFKFRDLGRGAILWGRK